LQSFEFFEKLLEIEKPWCIPNLELNVNKIKAKLKIEYSKITKELCAQCKNGCTIYDKNSEKCWLYINIMQFFSIHFLQNATIQYFAKKVLRLSMDEVHGIQKRSVERNLKKRTHKNIKYIGVDKKNILTGHKYMRTYKIQ
jgi:hypothetical protein